MDLLTNVDLTSWEVDAALAAVVLAIIKFASFDKGIAWLVTRHRW